MSKINSGLIVVHHTSCREYRDLIHSSVCKQIRDQCHYKVINQVFEQLWDQIVSQVRMHVEFRFIEDISKQKERLY